MKICTWNQISVHETVSFFSGSSSLCDCLWSWGEELWCDFKLLIARSPSPLHPPASRTKRTPVGVISSIRFALIVWALRLWNDLLVGLLWSCSISLSSSIMVNPSRNSPKWLFNLRGVKILTNTQRAVYILDSWKFF